MPRRRRSPKSQSTSRLGSELSAVINRVRSAFGPISMRAPATRPQIKQAGQVIDQTARQLLRGEADLSTWYRVLRQYENTWMIELESVRGAQAVSKMGAAQSDAAPRCAA